MTRRERVMAAVRGAPVDRVPVSLWLHNFATENSAETLAAETLRLARRFEWDFLKPQSRAQCFAEMWGLRYAPSRERATPYTVTRAPLATAADLRRLEPADARTGALGEQLQALQAIRKAMGAETPIIWTVFSPLMVLPYLLVGGRTTALPLMRSEPAAMDHALDAMAVTLGDYARAAVEAGADGLFYATNMATRELSSAAECRRFQRPYDLRILRSVETAPFNVLHVCGPEVLFDEFADYPATVLSWATVPGNPSLADGHRRTGRAVLGGLPAKPVVAGLPPSEVEARGRRAIAEMRGRFLLLGPDCSIDPDTPEAVMDAASAAAR
ncbi:MAG: uroporphyrinogen decarboxylase [Candidatus Rokuibacteriota bacterium]|nr:MAG: uroporphyrinogen decarboxylase [Candidatus Rokubacteria bacterium]